MEKEKEVREEEEDPPKNVGHGMNKIKIPKTERKEKKKEIPKILPHPTKQTKVSLFCYFKNTLFDQKSPVHTRKVLAPPGVILEPIPSQ